MSQEFWIAVLSAGVVLTVFFGLIAHGRAAIRQSQARIENQLGDGLLEMQRELLARFDSKFRERLAVAVAEAFENKLDELVKEGASVTTTTRRRATPRDRSRASSGRSEGCSRARRVSSRRRGRSDDPTPRRHGTANIEVDRGALPNRESGRADPDAPEGKPEC